MVPVIELLRKVAIFKDLEDGELARISEVCREQSFQAGEYIFREGESGNRLFLIVEGDVRISRVVPGSGEEALAIMKPGAKSPANILGPRFASCHDPAAPPPTAHSTDPHRIARLRWWGSGETAKSRSGATNSRKGARQEPSSMNRAISLLYHDIVPPGDPPSSGFHGPDADLYKPQFFDASAGGCSSGWPISLSVILMSKRSHMPCRWSTMTCVSRCWGKSASRIIVKKRFGQRGKNKIGSMQRTPDDEPPRSAVPQPSEQHGDHLVNISPHLTFPISTQRYI